MSHTTRLRQADFVTNKGLMLVILLGVAAAGFGLAQTNVGQSLLRDAGLYEEPASYTSLAFTHPQSLPTHLSRSPTQVGMSFALGNRSDVPHSYRWSIALERTGRIYRLADGEVQVPADTSITVARTVTASCAGGQARMTVQLAAPDESIDYWVACS